MPLRIGFCYSDFDPIGRFFDAEAHDAPNPQGPAKHCPVPCKDRATLESLSDARRQGFRPFQTSSYSGWTPGGQTIYDDPVSVRFADRAVQDFVKKCFSREYILEVLGEIVI
ncbi:MAG: hypothetical protein ACREMQ_11275, partial [Longimicrobiales bacterium]